MLKILVKLVLLSALFFAALAPAQELHDVEPPHISVEVAKELRCLELNLYHEARGESIEGIKAVANVTINRAKSGKFPDTICKVITQPSQFSWVSKALDKYKVQVPPHISLIAFNALLGNGWTDNTHGALYFHNLSVEHTGRRILAKIGQHIFS